MKFSMRTVYALRTMFDLAYHDDRGPIPMSDISRREAISVPYVEQVLFALRRRGLVASARGVKGGYRLARPPEEITVGEVIRVFEEKGFRRLQLPELRRGERYHAIDHVIGALVWAPLAKSVNHLLGQITFKRLCDEAKKVFKSDTFEHPYMVHAL